MKYNVLYAFKEYLDGCVESGEISKNTAKRYYTSITGLFQNFQFNSLAEIDIEDIKNGLSKLKYKNDISSAKNGLKLLHQFDRALDIPDDPYFKELSKKRGERRSGHKEIPLDKVKRTINQISDKKLKLAYRLALISGLRVSELADLETRDINLNDDELTIKVRNGKGGKARSITARPDKYVAKELGTYLKDKPPDEKLFYSDNTMKKKAHDLGFECHDLRRAFAQTSKKQLMKEGERAAQAIDSVRASLGHSKLNTTMIYLNKRKIADIPPPIDQNETPSLPKVIKSLAKELIGKARESEPEITSLMKSLEKDGVYLEGLEHRIKGQDRLEEKIKTDTEILNITPEQAAAGISDSVRYTLIAEDDKYIQAAQDTIDKLLSSEIEIMKFKNFWGGDQYQGINMQLMNSEGIKFEMQLHTPESFNTNV